MEIPDLKSDTVQKTVVDIDRGIKQEREREREKRGNVGIDFSRVGISSAFSNQASSEIAESNKRTHTPTSTSIQTSRNSLGNG